MILNLVCHADAPSFASPVSYVVAKVGDSVTMSCDADSNPQPSIIWYRPDTGKIIGNSQDLLIVSLKPSDFGLYICIATTLNFSPVSHQTYIFEPGYTARLPSHSRNKCHTEQLIICSSKVQSNVAKLAYVQTLCLRTDKEDLIFYFQCDVKLYYFSVKKPLEILLKILLVLVCTIGLSCL